MKMYENYLTAALAIYAIDRLVNWYHLYALRALADEAMFPADDPIMTSSIEAFEYEDEEEEAVPPNWEYDAPEPEEPPVAVPAYEIEEPLPDIQLFDEIEIEEATDVRHLPNGAHEEQQKQCQGITKSGAQCRAVPAKDNAMFCRQHRSQDEPTHCEKCDTPMEWMFDLWHCDICAHSGLTPTGDLKNYFSASEVAMLWDVGVRSVDALKSIPTIELARRLDEAPLLAEKFKQRVSEE
jgi:hypothetical protein